MKMNKIIKIGIIITCLIAMLTLTGCFGGVGYNEYAYKKSIGGILSDQLYSPGMHMLWLSSFTKVNNQVQSYNIDLDAASNDMQQIKVQINLNIQLKKDMSYEFIKNYPDMDTYKKYLDSKIQEKTKTIIFRYQAADLLVQRLNISRDILSEIDALSEIKYFDVKDIALVNIAFSDDYEKSIEQRAQLDIQKGIILKQKENLQLQTLNINSIDVDKYFKYQMIEKWDGKSSLIVGEFPQLNK